MAELAAKERRVLRLLAGVCALWAVFQLTRGSFNLLAPVPFGLTFNSMAAHLLAGRFDVDPAAVGAEGFARDGRIYAYFGIFCALLRLPWLAAGGAGVDATVLSCAVAMGLTGWLKIRMVLRLGARFPDSPNRAAMQALLIAALAFGGVQVELLRPSIYQEVVDWAGCLATGFVGLALEGLLGDGFGRRRLGGMAVLAALALTARVSTGLGLYVALGLLVLLRWPGWRALPVVIVVLAAGLAVTLGVNVGRWGAPLEFAPLSLNLMAQGYAPERIGRAASQGAFNLARLGFGLQYYILPLWVLPDGQGGLLFATFRDYWLDAAELPPSSFLLTDTLLLALGGVALRRLPAAAWLDRRVVVGLALGLAVPPGLMLIAISMNHRYRTEFDGLFLLLGLLGAAMLLRQPAAFGAGLRRWLLIATAIGVVGSHATLLAYQHSPFGPGQRHLQHGLLGRYLHGE